MKKVIALGISVCLITALGSCAKWFNTDIEDVSVILLSPPNNHSDSIAGKTFWWEEVEGAEEYQLQVVSPSFDSIVRIALDSTMDETSFITVLTSAEYQWRVRPVNQSYNGQWSTRTLTVVATNELTGQSINGVIPSSTYSSNDSLLNFSWTPLSNATGYIFVIYDNFDNQVFRDILPSNSTSYSFITDGTYTWNIQGQNLTSVSSTSSGTFVLDRIAPSKPTLTYPVVPTTDTITSFPASFTWSRDVDNGTAITDSVFISTTSDFTELVDSKVVSGVSSATFDALSDGDYFWKIGTVDAVGNYGEQTPAKPFVVKK
jgi:hypothetical protein